MLPLIVFQLLVLSGVPFLQGPAVGSSAADKASPQKPADEAKLRTVVQKDKVAFDACMKKVEAANPFPERLKAKRADPAEEEKRNREGLAILLKQFPGILQCKANFNTAAAPKLVATGATKEQAVNISAEVFGEKKPAVAGSSKPK